MEGSWMSFELSTQGGGGMKIKKWKSVSKTIVRRQNDRTMLWVDASQLLVQCHGRIESFQEVNIPPPSIDDHPDNNLNLYDLHYLICSLDSKEQGYTCQKTVPNTSTWISRWMQSWGESLQPTLFGRRWWSSTVKCLPGKEGHWVVTGMIVPDNVMWLHEALHISLFTFFYLGTEMTVYQPTLSPGWWVE